MFVPLLSQGLCKEEIEITVAWSSVNAMGGVGGVSGAQ